MKRTILFFLIIIAICLHAGDINVSGYTVKQFDASHTYTLPDTVIHEGDFIVIARDCSKGDFETFWNVVLGSNVLFINSGNTLPMINGDESFAVYDSSGNTVDSTAVVMPAGENKSIQRDSTNVDTWTILNSDQANPGYFGGDAHNAGLVITEFTDSTGSGNYIYEFVELYNDPNITGIERKQETCNCIFYDRNSSILIIENSGNANSVTDITIYNIAGQQLKSEQTSAEKVYIDMKMMPAGKYIVKVTNRYLSTSAIIITI